MNFLAALTILFLAKNCYSFLPVAPIAPFGIAPPFLPLLPPGLLLARPFLARRLLLTSLLLGKRDVKQNSLSSNETSSCNYTRDTSLLRCEGLSQKFECQVTERLSDSSKLNATLKNLQAVHVNETNFGVFNLFTTNSNFTFIRPDNHQKVTLSIYNSQQNNQSGLQVQNSTCWNNIQKLYEESSQINFELNF
ncbi:unnamed protein product [Brachionus calyciflorus]|uniref:Uncharacterized protein n=1 Tax=Brachionus calyciflorus TaxID=104777 RepID=A0A813RXD6_9BILA|nr:unnamed protein product [Brachionus calyciflorus]